MAEQQWTIFRCPECGDTMAGARATEAATYCTGFMAAHNRAKMEPIDVVARAVADQLADSLKLALEDIPNWEDHAENALLSYERSERGEGP